MQMVDILGLCCQIQGHPTFFVVSLAKLDCNESKDSRYALVFSMNPKKSTL
jgi:hypothetical protein